ncbi:ComEC/Rec2 family competence protein [Halocatena pleomorpha]|uniref:MBL fold metallo-hydrolase n=1 Tax=Halocatena pleomorpha TaxID=1785090 RepID=A0A3P3R283_9EURY|nr:MBL fold metallo-hydrolase [Halocatena pleomorpha]RRJ27581.1 MBL fold metallo-hydrolase [Halocatena pleomorpha]
MGDYVNSSSDGQFRVDMIDVGQGDSILLESEAGTTMLVDSGPGYNSDRVLDHLNDRNINYIDHFVTTHYDTDHIGGHPDIIEAYGSDHIGTMHAPHREGVEPPNTKTMDQFKDALEENDLRLNKIEEGDSFDLDGSEVNVLNPSQAVENTDRNENSVVMQVTHGDQGILLASDVEGEAETRLRQEYPVTLSHTNVTKVAHHGSENGTDFRSLVRSDPDSLLISSSLNNKYNINKNEYNTHPHDKMLKRVHDQQKDIGIYWTPVHGTTSTIVEEGKTQIKTASERDVLSAADVTALKYYGRSNDLGNSELANCDEIPFADLPDETPKWACEASVVNMDRTLAEATDQTEAERTTEEPTETIPQTNEELFEKIQAYADDREKSVADVLQSMQQKHTAASHDDTASSETTSADSEATDADQASDDESEIIDADDTAEETVEAGAEGVRIHDELRSTSVEDGGNTSTSKNSDKHRDEDMGSSL